ncbi:MAG: ribbon-helix-helix domain-containing protein [Desulfobacterales bacterium]|nr:ribbon-helix-helix domain-containing protein [Desulfobacterales bacterium]
MIRTQIMINEEQWKWIKLLAVEKGISMSQLIRDSIDSYRAQKERYNAFANKKKKAITAVGSFSAGQKKIKAQH